MQQEEVLQIIMTKLLQTILIFLTPKRAENSTHVFHQYTLRILNGKRNELQAFLAEKKFLQ
eukprot:GAFH01006488.1.p2 GENE.GAFH01006488.1~~GAFH01006488.1.p2  ORF type:complete len:61 (-),score=2.39 GAFH01006488.1:237-419(-)